MELNRPTEVRREMAGRGVAAFVFGVILLLGSVVPTLGQQQAPSIFGQPQPQQQQQDAPLPPEGSPVLLRAVEIRFPTQGNVGGVDYDTYLYYMEIKDHISLPSQGKWVPYSEATEQVAVDDHQRLWDTGFLSDLWIEVVDDPYPNGVPAKRIIFNLEERERVKIVRYEGSDEVKVEDINLNLDDQGIAMRLDAFVDPGTIRRVKWLIRSLFAAKGYAFAEVDHSIEPLVGGPNPVVTRELFEEAVAAPLERIGARIGAEHLGDVGQLDDRVGLVPFGQEHRVVVVGKARLPTGGN